MQLASAAASDFLWNDGHQAALESFYNPSIYFDGFYGDYCMAMADGVGSVEDFSCNEAMSHICQLDCRRLVGNSVFIKMKAFFSLVLRSCWPTFLSKLP